MKFILGIITSFLFLNCMAQEPVPYRDESLPYKVFFPRQGATWYYKNIGTDTTVDYIKVTYAGKYRYPVYWFWNTAHTYYGCKALRFEYLNNKFEIVKDTLIFFDYGVQPYIKSPGDTQYQIYHQILLYDKKFQYNFDVYLDFGKSKTDPNNHWKLPILSKNDYFFSDYKITDTFGVDFGAGTVRALVLENFNSCQQYFDTAFEIIGSLGYFFPLDVCNGFPVGGPLVCYKDDSLELFKRNNYKCPCEKINEINIEGIFPNPFNDELYIRFDQIPKNAVINIYNMLGKQVYENKYITDYYFKIEFEKSISNGMYIIKISNNENEKNIKVIKF